MKTKTTVVKGLAIDVVVIETMQEDATGHLFYVAEIFVQGKKNNARQLVRRTRVPGTGRELATAVQQRGIQALRNFLATP